MKVQPPKWTTCAAGGVAVEDLEQEQVDGGGRVEDAFPPGVLAWRQASSMVSRDKPAAMSWRSRSRMGMIAAAWEGSVRHLCGVVTNPRVPGVPPMLKRR